ncbi:YncE family protein [Actinotalea subterranea]|uniref:YncE family protein n=1 Tax=Actinotalea subterranea TaxID=2607497 RepID=UPI0011F03DCA|nr:hypothetical protein [Actinotalea subterranea]
MERELSDVMAEAVAARERALTGLNPAPEAVAGMRARVRRRRGVRRGLQALAVVPVVGAAVLAAALIGHDPAPVPPVHTDSPTPTQEPTPTPTSSPSSTPTPSAPELGAPVLEPGLPPFHEAPEGILDEAGPGWFLVTWQTHRFDEASFPASDTSVLLVDPAGTRYRLLTLPSAPSPTATGDPSPVQHEVVDWEAGASTAVMRVREGGSSIGGPFVTLDLLTGEMQPVDAGPDRVWFEELEIVATTADGTRLWRGVSQESTVLTVTRGEQVQQIDTGVTGHVVEPSPDGSLVWVGGGINADEAVVDLASGSVVARLPAGETASGWCEVSGWWADDTVLQTCTDNELLSDEGIWSEPESVRLVTADVAQLVSGTSTPIRTLSSADVAPFGWDSANVGEGVVAVAGAAVEQVGSPEICPVGGWLIDADGARLIDVGHPGGAAPAQVEFGTTPGRLVIWSSLSCHEAVGPDRLVAYDVATGALIDLAGSPHADDGGYSGGPVSWVAGR